MATKDVRPLLNAKDIEASFADPAMAARFPPVLTVDQAADLIQVPKQTIYDWSSRGRLNCCSCKAGKHLRFFRTKLLLFLFNQGVNQ